MSNLQYHRLPGFGDCEPPDDRINLDAWKDACIKVADVLARKDTVPEIVELLADEDVWLSVYKSVQRRTLEPWDINRLTALAAVMTSTRRSVVDAYRESQE